MRTAIWFGAALSLAFTGCLHDWSSVTADGEANVDATSDGRDSTNDALDAATDSVVVPVDSADGVSTVDARDARESGAVDATDANPPSDGSTCQAGACDGGCVDLQTDPQNCGRCGMVCPSVAHGTPACVGGTCGATCSAGFVSVNDECQVAPPQLIAPMSTSYAFGQQPTFRWLNAAGTGSTAQVDICYFADCNGSNLFQSVANVTSPWTPSAPLPNRVMFWRVLGTTSDGSSAQAVPSTAWEVSIPARNNGSHGAWGSFPDTDGDGFADIIVGAVHDSAAFVYRGTSGTLSSMPVHELTPPSGETAFGFLVADGGDIDGDGRADLLVTGNNGVYVLLDGATHPSQTLSPPNANIYFGSAITTLGDMNGDGFGDVAVTASAPEGTNPLPGQVYLYTGSASGTLNGPITTLTAPSTNDIYGAQAVGGIDIDGDGLSELAISAPDNDVHTVYVYSMLASAPTTPSLVIAGDFATFFGWGMSAGDSDGDGLNDLVISGSATDQAWVLRGASLVGQSSIASGAFPSGISAASGTQFSWSIADVGDVNGDGYTDVLAGTDTGTSAYLYLGSATGIDATTPFTTINAPSAMSGSFGQLVAGAGDVNLDGRADFVIAAPSAFAGGYCAFYLGAATAPYMSGNAVVAASPTGTHNGNSPDFGGSLVRREAVATPFEQLGALMPPPFAPLVFR